MEPNTWIIGGAVAVVLTAIATSIIALVRLGTVFGEGRKELALTLEVVSKRLSSVEEKMLATAGHEMRLENLERGLKEIVDSFKVVSSTVTNLDKNVAVFIAKSDGNHESLRRDLADLKGYATQRREIRLSDKGSV